MECYAFGSRSLILVSMMMVSLCSIFQFHRGHCADPGVLSLDTRELKHACMGVCDCLLKACPAVANVSLFRASGSCVSCCSHAYVAGIRSAVRCG